MAIRYLFLLIIIFSGKTCFSQDTKLITINFVETLREDGINAHWRGAHVLQLSSNTSIYFSDNTKKQTNLNSNENAIIFKPNSSKKNEDFLYKDYTKNEMYSKDLIGFRFKTIKDSINNFNWSIKKDTLKILGYTCNLAETDFRGRTYKVWFTTDLPAGGPWKLDGLPGLILKADTNEGYFSVEATQINISVTPKKNVISNPFELEKKLYTWYEFKQLYKEKAIKTSKFRTSEMNGVITTPTMGLERYIDKDDPDYNPEKIINSLNEKRN